MSGGYKSISKLLFICVLVCFFLPFVLVSCSGQQVKSFSGIQMVTGTTINNPTTGKSERVAFEVPAVVAFSAAALALIISFIKNKYKDFICACLSIAGSISLIVLKSQFTTKVTKQHLLASFKFGYYLTFLLFIGAAVFCLFESRDLLNGLMNKDDTD